MASEGGLGRRLGSVAGATARQRGLTLPIHAAQNCGGEAPVGEGREVKRLAVGIVMAIALLAGATTAIADDAPTRQDMYVVGSGANVRPMKNASIRMAAETVQAILYSRFAEYRIDFRFDNGGAAQAVLLGFPFNAPDYLPLKKGDTYVAPAGFWAAENGKSLAVALEHGAENGTKYDYYTHSVTFPPGETTVTVGYLIAPQYENGRDPADLPDDSDSLNSIPPTFAHEFSMVAEYDYTLHTGSYWNGPIGTAVLQWRLSPDFVGWGAESANAWESEVDTSNPLTSPDADGLLAARIQSAMTTPAPGVYRWTLHDFVPEVRLGPDAPASPYDLSFFCYTSPPTPKAGYANAYRIPTARASSSFSSPPYAYPAQHLVDGDPSTAWAEGATGGGIGQWVDVTFPKTRHIAELRILPGYAKRPELFTKYGRPKTLRFDFSDGTSQQVTLADSPTLQRFPVAATARSARMTIVGVYHGSVSDRTYVSEVEFGSSPAPAFDDPGTLLAEARTVRSADATPIALSVGSAKPAANPPAPAQPGPLAPLALAALAATLLGVGIGVGVVLRRKTPQ